MNAFNYDQCAPLTWGAYPASNQCSSTGLTKASIVSTAYGTSLVKTPCGIYIEMSRGLSPIRDFPALLCVMDWLKAYGNGYGLEALIEFAKSRGELKHH